MAKENKKMLLSLHVLKQFVLKVEMEKRLYAENMKILLNEAKAIRDQYKHSFEIENFLNELSRMKDIDEMQSLYEEFSKKKIDDKLCYGDIFTVRLDELSQGKIVYAIKSKKINADFYHPDIGVSKYYQVTDALKQVGEKVISNSVQAFEKCFESLLYRSIKNKPEAFLYGKNIEYAKLISCDVEELKESLVRQEVENLMRGVSNTIAKLNEVHKWHLETHQDLWDRFIEVDLHRNIIVHNNGWINNEYLGKVPEQLKKQKLNTYIICDKECVEEKTNILLKFAFLLYYLMGKTEYELDELDRVAFGILKDENWDVAEYAYSLLLKTKQINHVQKTNFELNYFNAKKHRLGKEKIIDEIRAVDVSGMKEMYAVAKKLLLEDYSNLADDLERCYPDDFNSYLIQTWPIFIEYRKTQEYISFKNKHKEDFEQYEYPSKQDV